MNTHATLSGGDKSEHIKIYTGNKSTTTTISIHFFFLFFFLIFLFLIFYFYTCNFLFFFYLKSLQLNLMRKLQHSLYLDVHFNYFLYFSFFFTLYKFRLMNNNNNMTNEQPIYYDMIVAPRKIIFKLAYHFKLEN